MDVELFLCLHLLYNLLSQHVSLFPFSFFLLNSEYIEQVAQNKQFAFLYPIFISDLCLWWNQTQVENCWVKSLTNLLLKLIFDGFQEWANQQDLREILRAHLCQIYQTANSNWKGQPLTWDPHWKQFQSIMFVYDQPIRLPKFQSSFPVLKSKDWLQLAID